MTPEQHQRLLGYLTPEQAKLVGLLLDEVAANERQDQAKGQTLEARPGPDLLDHYAAAALGALIGNAGLNSDKEPDGVVIVDDCFLAIRYAEAMLRAKAANAADIAAHPPVPTPVEAGPKEAAVEPGEGYRLIDKEKDYPMQGDEYRQKVSLTWAVREDDSKPFYPWGIYRRKIDSL